MQKHNLTGLVPYRFQAFRSSHNNYSNGTGPPVLSSPASLSIPWSGMGCSQPRVPAYLRGNVASTRTSRRARSGVIAGAPAAHGAAAFRSVSRGVIVGGGRHSATGRRSGCVCFPIGPRGFGRRGPAKRLSRCCAPVRARPMTCPERKAPNALRQCCC